MIRINWNDAALDAVKRLWNEGKTAAEITKELNNNYRKISDAPFSRNAVIGKVHRMGLEKRSSPIITAQPRPMPQSRHEAPAPKFSKNPPKFLAVKAKIEADEERTDLVSLLDIKPSQCRWPIGDPKLPGFGFCGHAKTNGGPYCEHHAARAYSHAKNARGVLEEVSTNH